VPMHDWGNILLIDLLPPPLPMAGYQLNERWEKEGQQQIFSGQI
jgi:hypothetical protein